MLNQTVARRFVFGIILGIEKQFMRRGRDIMSRAVALTERVIALVEAARAKTVAAVNLAMVYTYYEIGRQIVEEEQGGKRRAGYGETLLIDLSKKLTARFGRGWSVPNLKNIRLFYVVYSKRITDVEPARTKRINTVYPIPEFTLSWSHYLKLMRIDDLDERAFYEIESRLCPPIGVKSLCSLCSTRLFLLSVEISCPWRT